MIAYTRSCVESNFSHRKHAVVLFFFSNSNKNIEKDMKQHDPDFDKGISLCTFNEFYRRILYACSWYIIQRYAYARLTNFYRRILYACSWYIIQRYAYARLTNFYRRILYACSWYIIQMWRTWSTHFKCGMHLLYTSPATFLCRLFIWKQICS